MQAAGIFLMGYGLVAIPRTLWRLADVRGRQRLTCHKAGVQARKALDAHKCVLILPPQRSSLLPNSHYHGV